MQIDSTQEPLPRCSWSSSVHEKVGAVFVGIFDIRADAWPVIVRHYVIQRDAVGIHEIGCEPGRLINGECNVIASVLAHLDADAVVISRAVKVSMLTLFTAGQVLDGHIGLHGKVPGEEPDAIASGALGGAQGSSLEGQRVIVGVTTVVLGAVDGDVAGRHGPVFVAADFTRRDQIGFDTHFSQKLIWRDTPECPVIVTGFPHGDFRASGGGRSTGGEDDGGEERKRENQEGTAFIHMETMIHPCSFASQESRR